MVIPDHLDTDTHEKAIKSKMSKWEIASDNRILELRSNSTKTMKRKKEMFFSNLTVLNP